MHIAKPATADSAHHTVSINTSQLDSAGVKSDLNASELNSAAEGPTAPTSHSNADRPVAGQHPRQDGIRRQSKQQQREQQSEVPAGSVSRDDIRRALAFVSTCYPHARPSRGALRQVYNFLLQSERSNMAAVAREADKS